MAPTTLPSCAGEVVYLCNNYFRNTELAPARKECYLVYAQSRKCLGATNQVMILKKAKVRSLERNWQNVNHVLVS